MIKQALLLLVALFLLAACGQRPSGNLDVDMDDVEAGELPISSETMNEIVQNVASPIEVAALIQSLHVPFSTSYLADPEKLSASTTSFEMAFQHQPPG
jgi:uncharacterized lipoprotein YajG